MSDELLAFIEIAVTGLILVLTGVAVVKLMKLDKKLSECEKKIRDI